MILRGVSSCTSVLKRRQVVERAPAVVEELALLLLEAAGAVQFGAAAMAAVGIDADADELVDLLGRPHRREFAG